MSVFFHSRCLLVIIIFVLQCILFILPNKHSFSQQIVPGLPKTRSGKIMRRILRKIANNLYEELGDVSTLANPPVVNDIVEKWLKEAKNIQTEQSEQ